MSIYNTSYELARLLAKGEEHQAYEAARAAIEKDEGAMWVLRDFRSRQMKLEMAAATGQKTSEEEIEKFSRLSESITMHRPVMGFLSSEMRLLRVITDVQKILLEGVRLWDYMETADNEAARDAARAPRRPETPAAPETRETHDATPKEETSDPK